MRHILHMVLLAAVFAVAVPAAAFAAPDHSDLGFGYGGIAVDDFGIDFDVNHEGDMRANAVERLPSGRLLVAGNLDREGWVSAFDSEGDFDVAYGPLGDGTTRFTPRGRALDIQALPDGGALLVGSSYDAATGDDRAAVWKLTPAGRLDPTFGGGDGVADPVLGEPHAGGEWQELAVQSDGRILVVGTRTVPGRSGPAMARYTGTGALDPSFGSGGVFAPNGDGEFSAVALEASGTIIGSFNARCGGVRPLTAVRVSAAGVELARMSTSFQEGLVATDVVVQPSGRIVVGGSSDTTTLVMARFLASGSLDTSFGGGDGWVAEQVVGTAASHGAIQALAQAPSGRLVLAGTTGRGGECRGAIVARYSADGIADPSFGTAGVVIDRFCSSLAAGVPDVLVPRRRTPVSVSSTTSCTSMDRSQPWLRRLHRRSHRTLPSATDRT